MCKLIIIGGSIYSLTAFIKTQNEHSIFSINTVARLHANRWYYWIFGANPISPLAPKRNTPQACFFLVRSGSLREPPRRWRGLSWARGKTPLWFFPQNRRHYGIFKRGPYRGEAADRFHAPQAPGNGPNPSGKRAAGAVQVPNHPGGAPHQSLRNSSAFN